MINSWHIILNKCRWFKLVQRQQHSKLENSKSQPWCKLEKNYNTKLSKSVGFLHIPSKQYGTVPVGYICGADNQSAITVLKFVDVNSFVHFVHTQGLFQQPQAYIHRWQNRPKNLLRPQMLKSCTPQAIRFSHTIPQQQGKNKTEKIRVVP